MRRRAHAPRSARGSPSKLMPKPGATTNHKIHDLHYALTPSFSSGHAPPLPLRQQACRRRLAVCYKLWLGRTLGARQQVRPDAGRLCESTPAASHNQCPCPRRRRSDRLARRAIRRPNPAQRPISPPVQSNFGGRNTSAPPKPACQEQFRPSRQTSTPPKPTCPFTCRPFEAIQCQEQPRGHERGELSALGTTYPPDPPRWSWQPTA